MARIIISTFILLILLQGCTSKQDVRLTAISEIVSEHPREALSKLDSINYNALSNKDRHFYDFLLIKANDKNYIRHTSDSLILDVISFYQNKDLYPEALYYGGRVYSDLGDYPTALHYFQMAIDELPSSTKNQELRCCVLSQTGRLLTRLSLYDEALPYIQSALEINHIQNDTINIIYNLQLLGGTYLRNANYKQAEKYFKQALNLSQNQADYHVAKSKMYIAAVKSELGDVDSALYYIRNQSEIVKPIVRNSVLGYASNIYLKAGILDTAYNYAIDLISSEDPTNKEIGYQVLLSPSLIDYSQNDTLRQYIAEYRTLLEDYYDNNSNQLAINQRNIYNYGLHEREKEKAELRVSLLQFWIVIFLFLVTLFVLTSLYFKNKSKTNIIRLQQALSQIEKLNSALLSVDSRHHKHSTDIKTSPLTNTGIILNKKNNSVSKAQERELRDRLKKELILLYENSKTDVFISQQILQSKTYQRMQDLIQENKIISENDNLWSEIEKVVHISSPEFKNNLNLLTLGRLTNIEYKTALLIKCGIRPTKMAILLGRSNGTIVSRRESLSQKLFDEKKGVKAIDGIIRLL